MRWASALSSSVLLAACAAHATGVPPVLASLRSHIEASDYRATGQLIRIDADGNRIISAISVEGLWFHGAMHTLIHIAPAKGVAASVHQDEPVRILLEMRPHGGDTIRIYRPHELAPAVLPFDKWDDSVMGAVFSYEDLLDSQYYWMGQAVLRSAVLRGRQCEVLESTPGPSDRTHYSEVQTWLDRTIDYPIYAEKVSKQGGVVKEFTYGGLRQTGQVWSATQVEAKIRGRAGSALLIIKRGSTKAHLSAGDFQPDRISHFEERP